MYLIFVAIIYGVPHTIRILEKLPYQPSKKSSRNYGKEGELKVLTKLRELDNDHHVFCGMRIGSQRRPPQIDFVVVSKRGIFSIEVKYWTDKFLLKEQAHRKKYGGHSPHSQADYCGRVLWAVLKSDTPLNNPPVRKILLATHGNMQHDSKYKYVDVVDLNNIISFIQTRFEKLSGEQVQKVNEYLIEYIPNCRRNYSLR